MKKKLKDFFTLARKADGGFTLVELIVVIAILAILAGVAVPAYSGYVEKANKQADISLISEVKHALELAYYADPDFKGGIVVLSLDAAPSAEGFEDAMAKTFGDGWATSDTLKLKYDGWSASFQDSNYYGKMPELVNTVNTLTGALKEALAFVEGGTGFNSYMDAMGITDSTEKANAAVFYVAEMTADLSTEKMNAACSEMVDKLANGSGSPTDKALAAMGAMNAHTGSSLSSAALMYAMASGFAEYYDEQHKNDEGYVAGAEGTPSAILAAATAQMTTDAGNGGISKAADAFAILGTAFQNMIAAGYEDAQNYAFGGVMANDAAAYADALKTMDAGKDALLDNENFSLSQQNCFSSVAVTDLLNAYSDGSVFVFANVTADGLLISSSIDE